LFSEVFSKITTIKFKLTNAFLNYLVYFKVFVDKMLASFKELIQRDTKGVFDQLMITLFFYFNNLFQFDKQWNQSVQFSEECLRLIQSMPTAQLFHQLPKLVIAHRR
jgi:hypothetical protein